MAAVTSNSAVLKNRRSTSSKCEYRANFSSSTKTPSGAKEISSLHTSTSPFLLISSLACIETHLSSVSFHDERMVACMAESFNDAGEESMR